MSTDSLWPNKNSKTLLRVSREFAQKVKDHFDNPFFKSFPKNDLVYVEVSYLKFHRCLSAVWFNTFNIGSFSYDSLIKDLMNMLKMMFMLNGLRVETTFKELDSIKFSIPVSNVYIIYVDDDLRDEQ